MLLDNKLSSTEQKIGQKYYLLFAIFNGVTFICLMDNFLVLYSLKLKVPDYYISFLMSLMLVTNVFMFVGKQLISKVGAVKTAGYSWLFRGIFGLFTLSAAWAVNVFYPLTIILLTIGIFGFFASRSVALTSLQPIIHEITPPEKRGKFYSTIFTAFYSTALISLVTLAFILKLSKSLTTFQLVILVGIICVMCATFCLLRVPERNALSLSSSIPIKETLKTFLKTPRYRRLIIGNISMFSMMVCIIPISMVVLKDGYGLSDSEALCFAVIQFIGGIFVAFINRIISEGTGPRPLLIIYSFLLLITAFLWAVAPKNFIPLYCGIIFFILGAAWVGINASSGHYFLTAISSDIIVGGTLVVNISTGIISGMAGIVIGSGALKILHYLNIEGLILYKTYYTAICILSLPALYAVINLERIKDWKVSQVLSLMFTIRDIRALYVLSNIEEGQDANEEHEHIKLLQDIRSDLSENILLKYLDSPRFLIRARALSALGEINFGEETKQALIQEVERGKYSTAYMAVHILGEHNVTDAIPVMRKHIHSDDIYLQGKCILMLAHMKSKDDYDEIEKIFTCSENPRIIIHGASALVEMEDKRKLMPLLKKSVNHNLPLQVKYEILCCIAVITEIENVFYKFLKTYIQNKENAVVDVAYVLESEPDSKNVISSFEKYMLAPEKATEKNILLNFMKNLLNSHPVHLPNKNRLIINIINKFLNEIKDTDKIYPELLCCILLSIINVRNPDANHQSQT